MEDEHKKGRCFIVWLFLWAFNNIGVQLVYAVLFSAATPLFVSSLYLQPSKVAIIIGISGPVSGFFTQPIVGSFSDSSESRFGRRRPFILVGAIFSSLSMIALAYSKRMGIWLGDAANGTTPHDHLRGIILAIISLTLIFISVNISQAVSRILVSDLLSKEDQQLGNSIINYCFSIITVIAVVLGAQLFLTSNPYTYMFTGGGGIVVLCCIPTLLSAKEKVYKRDDNTPKETLLSVFVKIFKAFPRMSPAVFKTCLVYFFAWCSYSAFTIYLTQFFATQVFEDKSYNFGIRMGMYALAGNSALSAVYSMILPKFVKLTSTRVVFFVAQLIGSACYAVFLFPTKVPTSVFFVTTSLIGISSSTFFTIPFSIVANQCKNERGLYFGVLNCVGTVAEVIAYQIAGVIVAWKKEEVSWGLAFSAVYGVISMFLALILPDDYDKEEELKPESETSRLIN